MKKNIAMKWVKALRSGKYEQGKKMLRSLDSKYCCFGVLCDISWLYEWHPCYCIDSGFYYYGRSIYILNDVVCEWAGMKHFTGRHKTVSGVDRSLTNYNDNGDLDGTPCTFDKIADGIEINYKAL